MRHLFVISLLVLSLGALLTGASPASAQRACGGATGCLDPVASRLAKDRLKADLRARPLPEAYVALVDRLPDCLACIPEVSGASVHLEWVTVDGDTGNVVWSEVSESLIREQMRAGRIKWFVVRLIHKTCTCCGQTPARPYTPAYDPVADGPLDDPAQILYDSPDKLGPDPDFLIPVANPDPVIHRRPAPRKRPAEIHVSCQACQGLADERNALIDKLWTTDSDGAPGGLYYEEAKLKGDLDFMQRLLRRDNEDLNSLGEYGKSDVSDALSARLREMIAHYKSEIAILKAQLAAVQQQIGVIEGQIKVLGEQVISCEQAKCRRAEAVCPPPGGAVGIGPLAAAVLAEINLARSDPQAYAARGGWPRGAEGQEALAFLASQPKVPALEFKPGLATAAAGHVADVGPKGLVSHVGSDGSGPLARAQKAGIFSMIVAEEISVSLTDPASVVRGLIVDASDPRRAHRKDLFDPGLRFIGVACGPNKATGQMCVIVLSGSIIRETSPAPGTPPCPAGLLPPKPSG